MHSPSPLYIPKPCHENWDKMSATEKGRFCKVCTKEVIDFTTKKQEEILTYLDHTEGATCGVFSPSQLNAQMQNEIIERSKPRWRKWVLSTIAFMGMMGWFKESKAQKMGKVAIRGDIAYVEHSTQSDSTIYNGTVYSKENNNKPVGGALIYCYSDGKLIAETTTIANGTFRLSIPPGVVINNTIDIEVSHDYGYDYSTYTIIRQNNRVNIYLGEIYKTLGEVVRINEDPQIDSVPEIKTVDTLSVCTFIIPDTAEVTGTTNEIISPDSLTKNTEDINILTVAESTEVVVNTGLNIVVYPNPGSTPFTIETGRTSRFAVNVYNESGQLISTDVFTGYKTSLSSDNLTPGTYLIEVIDSATGEKSIVRVIKL